MRSCGSARVRRGERVSRSRPERPKGGRGRETETCLKLAENRLSVDVRKHRFHEFAVKHALRRGALKAAVVERRVQARDDDVADQGLRRAAFDEGVQAGDDAHAQLLALGFLAGDVLVYVLQLFVVIDDRELHVAR